MICEFVIGVLFVLIVIGVFWFFVFGGIGIYMELFGDVYIFDKVKEMGIEVGLFVMFD